MNAEESGSSQSQASDAREAPQPKKDPSAKPGRLLSLDAYRGMIMTLLAASGFRIAHLASLPREARVWQRLDYDTWQAIAFHFEHPVWVSRFGLVGVSFWDLIQPAFMFMVGVAMPYSYARRAALGHSPRRQWGHAAWRAMVLVLMGVFLASQGAPQTNWIFTNVLAQIGLGYVFLYLLMGRRQIVQAGALAAILVGYWLFFFVYSVPEGYDYAAVQASDETVFEGRFAPWSKNANIGHQVDLWLLNQFPRPEGKPFTFNSGGYLTLNFVPSIATMLLGVFCGQLLRSRRGDWAKFGLLVAGGAACMALALVAGAWLCPIVKRIWTPSWVLFSGAWVIWMLAGFYLVFDLFRWKWLAFPLIVIGMNSITVYMMGQMLRPWTIRLYHTHLGWMLSDTLTDDDMFGRVVDPTAALIVFWLFAYWMYRQKFFVRV